MSLSLFAISLAACAADSAATSPFNPNPPPLASSGAARSGRAQSNRGDRYPSVGTNPFVSTEYEPFSTFGADVDTASYDVFRRDLNLGMVPQPQSVRLEDYVNAFRYSYPQPGLTAAPLAVSLAAVEHAFGRDTALMRVGIAARRAALDDGEVPASIVFLVDTSGSMQSADKLPLVKTVLSHALEVLQPSDRIAIVTYAGSAGVSLPSTPVAQSTRIKGVIDALRAGGSTAGAGGIRLAYDEARAGYVEGGINHIILCTDGDFNVGASSDQELVNLIERERESGVTLTALGFGVGNLNDSMMERVSNAGNGSYGVISSERQARRYVETRMLSALQLIAKDVKIQVEFNPVQVRAYRLLGYEDRALADDAFRDDDIDAGEVGAGMQVTALYELVLGDGAIPESDLAPPARAGQPVSGTGELSGDDLALVRLRYQPHGASDVGAALEVAQRLGASEAIEATQSGDADFAWAAALAAFAEILKRSPYANQAALPLIGDVIHAQAEIDPDRAEFVELFERWNQLR